MPDGISRIRRFASATLVALLFGGAAPAVDVAAAQSFRSAPGDDTSVRPFTIKISDAVLKDLRERLVDTRWPDQLTGQDWTYGTNIDYLKQLVAYWRDKYDWRGQ